MSLPKLISIDRSVRFMEGKGACTAQTVTVLNLDVEGQVVAVPAYPEAYNILLGVLDPVEEREQANVVSHRRLAEDTVKKEEVEEEEVEREKIEYAHLLDEKVNIGSI